jgi:CRISP-associated protein Cas1
LTHKDSNRLFVKITRETLPQVKDKYPFVYLERGRIEVDDSSIKWIDCEGSVVKLPVAILNCLLLGPGTSITHEAIKVLGSANCGVCWVGEDSMLFYAFGTTPTTDTRNFRRQIQLACDKKKSLETARKLFSRRFPDEELSEKNLQEMMGMEGYRQRKLYEEKAEKYGVGWKGRKYVPGNFQLSDITNQILTSANAALYGILCSVIHSMGYTPHVGFIHSGSPLPLVYDLADLYKGYHCTDLAFFLTLEMGGVYNKYLVSSEFRKRILECNLLSKIAQDLTEILGE